MGRMTGHIGKPMVPYAGTCRLVDFSVANVIRSGVPEVVVLSNHREGELIEHLVRNWDGHPRLRLNFGPHEPLVHVWKTGPDGLRDLALPPRPGELGTADALQGNAEWVFAPGARDVLLLHADHVYNFHYGPMLREHRETRADATIGVQRIERRFVHLFGMVELDQGGTVRTLVEKPSVPSSDLIFTAFSLFRRDALEEVLAALARLPPDGWQHDISRDVLPLMIDGGYRVRAFRVCGYWADIGTVERYHLGHLDMLRTPAAIPFASLPRTLPGATTMRMGPNQVISSVGWFPGACVRVAVLFPHCIVEPGAVIERSVILPGARVCEGTQVRDSVVLQNETVTGVREGLAWLV